jgi:catechol 2,3-dioxygenase-like lactoylglutathione lyase family enzyme
VHLSVKLLIIIQVWPDYVGWCVPTPGAVGYRHLREPRSTSNENYVVFHSKGALLALFPEKELAKDAQVDPSRTGFRGVTLAHNVANKEDVFWGGHSGYFSDPDGHLWEVAWNPLWKFNPDGSINLPL